MTQGSVLDGNDEIQQMMPVVVGMQECRCPFQQNVAQLTGVADAMVTANKYTCACWRCQISTHCYIPTPGPESHTCALCAVAVQRPC
jgi:hypothetical protein